MPICVKWICKRKFYCATKVLHCSTQTPELPQIFQVEQFFVRGSCYTTIYCHPSMKLSCLSFCSGPVQCDHCSWCIGTIQGPPPVQGSCPTPVAPLVQGPSPGSPLYNALVLHPDMFRLVQLGPQRTRTCPLPQTWLNLFIMKHSY